MNKPAISEGLPTVPEKIEIGKDWVEERNSLIERAEKLQEIQSQEDWEEAERLLSKITKTSNKLEKFRKDMGKPFREAAKKIKSVADNARTPLESVKARLKKVMSAYVQALEEKRREEEEKEAQRIAKEREAASESENPFDEVVAEEEQPAQLKTEQVNQTATKAVKVLDIKISNARNVPREYCSPDIKKIRAKAQQGERNIPGVEITERTDIRAR